MTLKELRISIGMTQPQVSEDTGIAIYRLSLLEHGHTPTFEECEKLNHFFGEVLKWPDPHDKQKVLEMLEFLFQYYPVKTVLQKVNKALASKTFKDLSCELNLNIREHYK